MRCIITVWGLRLRIANDVMEILLNLKYFDRRIQFIITLDLIENRNGNYFYTVIKFAELWRTHIGKYEYIFQNLPVFSNILTDLDWMNDIETRISWPIVA